MSPAIGTRIKWVFADISSSNLTVVIFSLAYKTVFKCVIIKVELNIKLQHNTQLTEQLNFYAVCIIKMLANLEPKGT